MTFIVSCEAGMSNPSRLGEAASAISSECMEGKNPKGLNPDRVHTTQYTLFLQIIFVPSLIFLPYELFVQYCQPVYDERNENHNLTF